MAIQNNFPAISPSLSLDFANVGALDPRITFARASAATYYGTDTAKAEENLLLQSQSFSTTPWSTLRTVLTGGQTAPDGTSTAWKFQSVSGETTAPNLSQTNNVTSGLAYVVSIHAKVGDRNFVRIVETLQTGSSVLSGFDLLNGTVGSSGSGHTTSIVDVGGGWYRCVVVFTANATRSGSAQFIATESATSNTVADNEGFIELWGAQLEQRDAVTNYTPTTTQRITNFVPVLESAASGEARFDHDPITGESLGLLIEESRTNLLLRSEEFDNAGWAKSNTTVTANTIVAPDGTLTGDKLVEDTANSSHTVNQGLITASTTTFSTFSFYAKAAGRSVIQVRYGVQSTVNRGQGNIDLSNGTVLFVQNIGTATGTTLTATAVGNDWYRVVITTNPNDAAATQVRPQVVLSNLPANQTTGAAYTGDGFSGIFIWGAQIEVGAFATSYIPTTTAQVTRAADSASMTGANFSSWFNQEQGAIYCEYKLPTVLGFATTRIFSINDNTFANTITLRTQGAGSNQLRPELLIDGTSAAMSYSVTGLGFSVFNKTLLGYKLGENRSVTNGIIVGTQGTLIPLKQMSRLHIGMAHTVAGQINGHIKKLSYYPQRLADAEQGGLTS